MEDQHQTSFQFVFDNLSEKKISSPKLVSGGSDWFVVVYPKEENRDFSVHLVVANPESLIRRVSFVFVIFKQSGKEILRTEKLCKLFCEKVNKRGSSVSLPLEARGILETNNVIVKLDLEKVAEVVVWNEMVDFNGFQIHYSQVHSHGDFARNISVTNQLAKTRYMNLLETLKKPPHSLTDTELSNTRSELVELTDAGFELNLTKAMLDKVSLDRDTENMSRIEQHIKEKVKAATDWLKGVVHSWKGSLGFALVRNEKID